MRANPNPATSSAPISGRVMWWLYNVAMILGALLWLPLLFSLAAASKKRRQSAARRLGLGGHDRRGSQADPVSTIWVHALSVGEVTAAQPLVQGLQQGYGHYRIVFTTSTHSGYETARRLFDGDGIEVVYFPYDLIFSVRAVADRIEPTTVILIETDIWPNFLREMKRRNVPVFLANFRMSDRTWRRCRALRGLSVQIFESFKRICVQTRDDAQRLESLGVAPHRICMTGSLKFDTTAQPLAGERAGLWRQQLRIDAQWPVIVAGSTHEGDESLLMTALASVGESDPHLNPMMIIAPRDPERSRSVVALCRQFDMSCHLLSEMQPDKSGARPDVVVVDYIGVLKELYGLATVAFIGGSLSNEGGHNPLEPAMYGKPVLFGKDMRDFRQMVAWLLEANGARQVKDGMDLAAAFSELLNDPEAAASMGHRALSVFQSHQGAVTRILENLSLD